MATNDNWKLSRFFSLFKKLGIDWVPAAADKDYILRSKQVTLTGGSTHSFAFAAEGWPTMADATYTVHVTSGTKTAIGRLSFDGKTADGFDICGGDAGGGEVASVMVYGKKYNP
jgi:hypothetical protein